MVVPKYRLDTRWMLGLYRTSDFTEVRQIRVNTLLIPVAISNDTQRAVTFSGNGRVHLLDMVTGQEIWMRTYSTAYTPQALFLPDGSGIILNTGSMLVRIANDGSEAWRLQVPMRINLGSITSDGKVIALRSGSNQELISIDIESLEIRTLYQSYAPLQHVAMTPDEQYIAVSRKDGWDSYAIFVFRYPTMEQIGVALIENYIHDNPVAGPRPRPVWLDSIGWNNEFHVYTLGTVHVISAETARVIRQIPLQNAYYNGFWRIPTGWATLRSDFTNPDILVYHPAGDQSQKIIPISYGVVFTQFADANQVIFAGLGNSRGGILWTVDSKPSEYHRFTLARDSVSERYDLLGQVAVGGGYFLNTYAPAAVYWYACEWPGLRVLASGTANSVGLIQNRHDLLVINQRQLYNWMTREYLWDINSTGLSGIRSFRFSPNANYCFIWLSSNVCWMYNTQTNTPLWNRSLVFSSVSFSQDSRYLLS